MVTELDATPAQQSIVMGLFFLPWALKIFMGFLSDAFPIGLAQWRRKPYLILGWALFISCNVALVIIGEPTIQELAGLLFLMSVGYMQADVCTDALVVERSKLFETSKERGKLQSRGYIIRFFGAVVGALCGAVFYNESWPWSVPIWGIFIINGLIPLIIVSPYLYLLEEMNSYNQPLSVRHQLNGIWELVQRKSVWKPCLFIYTFNIFLVQNPALPTFLVDGEGFNNFCFGLLVLFGTVLSFYALVIYKNYWYDMSWRKIFLIANILGVASGLIQLILIFRLNERIGMTSLPWKVILALSSYGMIQFVIAVQYLPSCRMFLGMCIDGSEATIYALLTTLSNLASAVSYSIAASLSTIWDVHQNTIENGDYSGVWKLTLLCSLLPILGLTFISYLPRNVDEQILQQTTDDSSRFAGTCFVATFFLSILFIISLTVYQIVLV